MFFIISKLLFFFTSPIIWIFTLLLLALLIRRGRKKLLLTAFCVFFFFTNSFILEEFCRLWEVSATKYENLKTYEAGIVLSGMLEYDVQFDRIQFYRGADRLFQTVELYKRGNIKKIFFVGGSGSLTKPGMKEGMFVRRYLLTLGIPDKDIWVENESRNTYENAVNSFEVLKLKGLQQDTFLLITSAYHMRRAMGCFKKTGLAVDSYSVDRNASPIRRYDFDHLFIPNTNALIWWDALIHEWVGVLAYKMKGYM